jgi:hypothetical protein
MNPRTLALATLVALFGAGASFTALANDPPSDEVQPVQEPTPASGAALDQDDPAVASDEIFDDDESLASDDDDTDAASSDATSMAATAGSTGTATSGSQAERDVALRDSNKNGSLEAGEVSTMSALTERFAEFDIDANGSVSTSEYQGWLAADPGAGTTEAMAASDGSDATMSSDDDDAALASEEVAGEEDRPSDAGTPDADSSDDGTAGLTAQTEDEAEETGSEDIGGEEDRPSDAGTPDVDSDEEDDDDLDDDDD